MKKASSLCPQEAEPLVLTLPAYEPDEVLALVDLLWLAFGCPTDVPS